MEYLTNDSSHDSPVVLDATLGSTRFYPIDLTESSEEEGDGPEQSSDDDATVERLEGGDGLDGMSVGTDGDGNEIIDLTHSTDDGREGSGAPQGDGGVVAGLSAESPFDLNEGCGVGSLQDSSDDEGMYDDLPPLEYVSPEELGRLMRRSVFISRAPQGDHGSMHVHGLFLGAYQGQ
jgi:hypothetical protein